jgi:hypothetical protein
MVIKYKRQLNMNKFDTLYNKIITEWNLFSKNKTQLKMYYDEADELMSRKDQIEKYIDYSDTNWTWNDSLSEYENILNLYNELQKDPANSSRISFLTNLLTDEETSKLKEFYLTKRENELINRLESNI